MNRVSARLGALSLFVIGTVAILAGPGGAVLPRPTGSDTVQVDFVTRGDLASLRGELRGLNCVERVQPYSFNLFGFSTQRVEIESSKSPGCEKNEVTWLLTAEAKAHKDLPETMEMRLRYGPRAQTSVEFLRLGKDLKWSSHVLGDSRVVIEITGR